MCFGRNGCILAKAVRNCVFCAKWLDFAKSCSKACVLAKMALSWQKLLKTVLSCEMAWFWQKLLKTVCLGQNDLILARAAKNGAFREKYLDVRKSCSKPCAFAKMGLLWQKLFKTVCFVWNGLILAKAAQNCVFWPKWLYLGKSCSKLCVLAKRALSWQKLFKTVVLAKIAWF